MFFTKEFSHFNVLEAYCAGDSYNRDSKNIKTNYGLVDNAGTNWSIKIVDQDGSVKKFNMPKEILISVNGLAERSTLEGAFVFLAESSGKITESYFIKKNC
jgi:hypothetical protein